MNETWAARRWFAVTMLVFCSCAMGYRSPGAWPSVRLPPIKSAAASEYMLIASRYQLQVCNSIGQAYAARANSRSVRGTVLTTLSAVFGAGGTALAAGGALQKADANAAQNMLLSGIFLTGASAIITAVDLILGDKSADGYSKSAESVGEAMESYREALRAEALLGITDAPTHNQDAALKERLCSLRSSCTRGAAGVAPLGRPFGEESDEALATEEVVDEYITALCSNNGASHPTLDDCLRAGPKSPSCAEVVCEAALANPNPGAARTRCLEFAETRANGEAALAADPDAVAPLFKKRAAPSR